MIDNTDRDLPPCYRCKHPAEDHHTSWLPGGFRMVEECETWPDECEWDCQGYLCPPTYEDDCT